jgi:hypothetical protein
MRTLKLELGPRVRIDFPFLPSAPDPTKSKKRDESLTRKPPSDTADSPKQKRPMAPVGGSPYWGEGTGLPLSSPSKNHFSFDLAQNA